MRNLLISIGLGIAFLTTNAISVAGGTPVYYKGPSSATGYKASSYMPNLNMDWYDMTEGWYIGGGIGAGQTRINFNNTQKNKKVNFAATIYGGKLLNKYVGIEAGFNYMPRTKHGAITAGGLAVPGSGVNTNNFSFDFAGALGVPIPLDSWDIVVRPFGKLGLAVVRHERDINISATTSANARFTRTALFLAGGSSFFLGDYFSIDVQALATTRHGPVPASIAGIGGVSFTYA